ncbi:MAG: ABC transporter substrate-binding protein [Bradyrhizobiaceae bacterium]|nr:ABC transporter substrate-binding protein [Bradyrhizobiaceae bacterium]
MSGAAKDVLDELAPTGTLRAAINLGNTVLAQRDPASGELRGVTVDLANELAREIGRPVHFESFEAAGKVFATLKHGVWDIAFLAIEPARAAEIDFTAPYVLIEGTYMVWAGTAFREIADVDRPGVRIAVGPDSAYDLFLKRTLQHATIVRAPVGGPRAMIDLFLADKLEAVAGVRQWLVDHAAKDPSVRVLDGRFMQIRQAMGLPKGRPAAFRYVRDFVERMKASGFVADALRRSGQLDAAVAPPDAGDGRQE